MKRKLYVLLVGINRYPSGIPALEGCVADVEDVRAFVEERLGYFDVNVEVLVDEMATRGNVIRLFRTHLCRAGEEDAVWFHFSGHGSRTRAPEEFLEFEPDGMHESLVCYDSRSEGGLDLADKEMAVLFAEVARRNPHILATFDCCHSGSGVREGASEGAGARFVSRSNKERPLSSYMDGYYVKHGISIPNVKMVFFAGCGKSEQAWEDSNHRGIFSRLLCGILRESRGRMSYADLFLRLRSAVQSSENIQNPQLECYEGVSAYHRFLDGWSPPMGKTYSVFQRDNAWFIRCGQIHGLLLNPLSPVRFSVKCPGGDSNSLGSTLSVRAVHIGIQESEIVAENGCVLDKKNDYEGIIEELPVPPLLVSLSGELPGIELVEEVRRERSGSLVDFARDDNSPEFKVSCRKGNIRILNQTTGRSLLELDGYSEENAQLLIMQLMKIERWKRLSRLDNSHSRLDSRAVDFGVCQLLEDNSERKLGSGEVLLELDESCDARGGIPYRIKVGNHSDRVLFFTLLYFAPDFGIRTILPCQEIWNSEKETILDDGHALFIPNRTIPEVVDTFVLVVTTERIDDFVFGHYGIGEWQQREIKAFGKNNGDWFAKRITIKTVWAAD